MNWALKNHVTGSIHWRYWVTLWVLARKKGENPTDKQKNQLNQRYHISNSFAILASEDLCELCLDYRKYQYITKLPKS